MYDYTFYKQVQISRSDIRPHIKWAVSLMIFHMVTSIFLRALCGYIWVPGGGHFLCQAVRDARLYMGYFWEIFCTFSVRWVPFFNKISVFFLQGGYLFWRKILYLSDKMEPIYKKFSVFYSTKLLHFTHKISVYFYMMSIFSRDLL